jgi:GNAT superfamily N-acetyltransferase
MTDRSADIRIAPEPYDSPDAQRLSRELEAEMVELYEVDTTAEGYEGEEDHHWVVRVEQVTPPGGVFLVARIDGMPVGSGAVRALPGGHPGVGEVKRMYTDPAARRRGVSRAILAELERRAPAFGYQRLQLETGSRQPEAIRLYETAGWHRIPPYGQYAADPDSICLAKLLASPQADTASIA